MVPDRFGWLATAVVLSLAGCAALSRPDNPTAEIYAPENAMITGSIGSPTGQANVCAPAGTAGFMLHGRKLSKFAGGRQHTPDMRYSPGDRINILIYGQPDFSGDYAVGADGKVTLPFAGAVHAVGLTNVELSKRVEASYLRSGIFTPEGLKLAIRPVQFAPINVAVTGAVFYPGRYMIGAIKDSDKFERALNKFGDNPLDRFVPSALRAAGGIRPDANLASVRLIRGGRQTELDWRGAFTGDPVDDLPLMEGDRLHVDEAPCFQSALVRPSQITPAGLRMTYSNMTQPTTNTAATIQSYQYAGSVPYGTRLLQALVQSNCIGGTLTTNARRQAVLITRNPKTLATEVVQVSVEELVRSAGRDAINPFLMPDDSIACYDSSVSEFRDVMAALQTTLLPVSTARVAFPGWR